MTPLYHAAASGEKGLFMQLLEYGADPDLQDAEGYSVFERARLQGNDQELIEAVKRCADHSVKRRKY